MSQLKVKFKKLNADTKLPVKGSLDAACYDVYATSVKSEYGGKVTYGLGFATEIPYGWRGVIVPRSNLTKHKWVMLNSPAQIDSDYRGEWMIKMSSIASSFEPSPYSVGDRVAQIYFERVNDVEFEEVEELESSERGSGGFGSTGIK
jgi:dUTP pyrophosphatase